MAKATKATKNLNTLDNYEVVKDQICSAFREIWEQSGMNQADFAKDIGVDTPYIKAVLQKRFSPSPAVIAFVCKKYKRSLNWIFFGSDK